MHKFSARSRRLPLDLSPGYPPWQPPGTVRLHVFSDDRGAPLDGLFLLGEHQQYLFTRVRFDPLAGTGQYAYVPLSPRTLRRLQHAGDTYPRLRERCLVGGVSYAAVEGIGDAQRITRQTAP